MSTISDTTRVPAPRRRRFWVFASLAVVLVFLFALGGVLRKAWLRDEAVKAAREGKFAEAEPQLRADFARNNADAEVVEALARGTLAAGDPAEAGRFLERWGEIEPGRTEPFRLLFDLHRKTKNWERAIPAGLRLRELEPGDSQLLRSLTTVAFEAGRFELAEGLCRELLRSQPDNPGFRVTLASIRRGRGDAAGSAAILDEVLKSNPPFAQALADRAAAYEESGEPAKAVPLLRELLKSDRQRQRSAGYRLSLALERIGEHEEARKVLEEVRRLQDVSTVEEAVKDRPGDPVLRVQLGERLLAAGHHVDGIRVVSSAFELDPGFAPAHRALAEQYEKNGQPARAAEHRRFLK